MELSSSALPDGVTAVKL